MSQNNDNDGNSAVGLVFAMLGILMLGAFILLMFVAFIKTLPCLVALIYPIRLGRFSISRAQAFAFILFGIVGAAAIPLFAMFCEVFFDAFVEWNYLGLMMAVGYTLGSLGSAMVMADQEKSAYAVYLPPTRQIEPPERPSLPDRKSFHYADWDDEEAGR